MMKFFLLIGGLTLLTFHRVLWNDFVTWDDGLLITGNPIVQEFSTRSVHRAFTSYDPELYIPLTFLSYQIDYLLWGLNPLGFHLTNLLLHTMNAILVFWLVMLLLRACHAEPVEARYAANASILRRAQNDTFVALSMWFNGHAPFVALVVALLWAVHPLNTEAVAWASARKDLLSGFFFLLSLCGYLKYRDQERVTLSVVEMRHVVSHSTTLGMTRYWYWSSIVSFLLGLFAKVSIAPLPFVLILLEWFRDKPQQAANPSPMIHRPSPMNFPLSIFHYQLIPFFLLSIMFGIIAIGGKHGNTELFSEKILIGAKATIFYLGKLLWPTGFSVLYPYTRPITWSNADLLLPLLCVILLSLLAFLFRKKCPMVAYGWAFFLLMLLPSFTNFAKGHDQLRDVYFASDRYAYLPSIGIFLLCISILYKLLTTHCSLLAGILSLLILPLPLLSYRQSLVWRTTETLFQNVTRHYPDSHIAWNNLGSIALGRGDEKAAFEDYDRSLAIRPNAAAFFNMGQIALQKGLMREAMELYRRAIVSRPNDIDSLLNLGVLHLRIGNATLATDLFRRAIAFGGRLPIVYFNLGLALEALKDQEGARAAFHRVLELDPNDREAREKLAQ